LPKVCNYIKNSFVLCRWSHGIRDSQYFDPFKSKLM